MSFLHIKKPKNYLFTITIVFILSWSIILGNFTAKAMSINPNTKSVDKVADNHRIGKELYLENCSSCHLPIPPAVLPTNTWKTILENTNNHYGVKIEGIIRFNQVLMWQYLSTYSRQLLQNENEPQFIAQSRYFFALHPGVELPSPVTHRSCLECHPKAMDFHYRE